MNRRILLIVLMAVVVHSALRAVRRRRRFLCWNVRRCNVTIVHPPKVPTAPTYTRRRRSDRRRRWGGGWNSNKESGMVEDLELDDNSDIPANAVDLLELFNEQE
uniref:uncharacterized protein LOC108950212 n=1 Tax=Ciona intestinalis TaxID=7719 RepID=UPI00089DC3C9|nr:uncharacterized protein LOC108950212 [Ciona intestinalis]XP_018670826.1 uncharacterized protein LOC108950212 [Ciona intestinalis]|eukprot:XP_018670825.1 uncharacterized protein LOC108950212 [Ciona intestinalis]